MNRQKEVKFTQRHHVILAKVSAIEMYNAGCIEWLSSN